MRHQQNIELQRKMSRYWGDIVKKLTPYEPGEQPKNNLLLKLNTNENPYRPSPRVMEAIKSSVQESLRLYPDPESTELRGSIAKYYGLTKSNIFVGNGSDEILAFIFQGLLKKDRPIFFPDITYSFYPVYCSLYDIKYKTIPLDAELKINFSDYKKDNGGIIFPNPNAPTGTPKSLDEIEELLKINKDSVVVVDEAYVDFGTESSVNLVTQYKNLVVTQSMSKSRSLAGMRVGFAFADQGLIEALSRIKNSFNSYPVDRLAQAAGIAAINDKDYFTETRKNIIEARTFLEKELLEMNFETLPSGANFVFTRHRIKNGNEMFKKLRDSGILVRHFNKPERISQYLRITVGTMTQMKQLVSILRSK